MKSLIVTAAIALSTTAFAAPGERETYKCFLDQVAYDKSPVVIVSQFKKVTTLEFKKSPSDWTILSAVKVADNSEDVLALFENEAQGVALSFYMDESDELGLAEGTIKSPLMNGSVKCLYVGRE